MKTIPKAKWILLAVTVAGQLAYANRLVLAQEAEGERSVGLTASVQAGQLDILLPIWTGPKTVFAPAFSFAYIEGAGADIGLGIAPRFYSRTERIAPYFSLRGGVFLNLPDGGDSSLDFFFGFAFGGEFFLDPKFSLGVEAQANGTISDDQSSRFGNPGGFNVNTAAAVTASIYF